MTKSLDFREQQSRGSIEVREPGWGNSVKERGQGMDLRDFLFVLKNRIWWIVAVTIVGVMISAAVTLGMTPVYSAKSTLFVTVQSSEDTAYARGQFALQRVGSYPQLINDPKIINTVISKLDLGRDFQDVKASLTASNPVDTVLITITATASTAKEAADMANTAAPLLAESISKLENTDSDKLLVKTELSVPASPPPFAIAPRKAVNLGLGLVSGLSLGLLVAMLVSKLDPRILRARDAERELGLPVLGTVPSRQDGKQRGKRSKNELGYRQLISNLLMANDGHLPHRILVMGEQARTELDGRQLAQCLAAMGKRAVILEGDAQSAPAIENEAGALGMSKVLGGSVILDDALRQIEAVPMGYIPAGESDLSLRPYDVYSRLEPLIGRLEAEFDVVIMMTALDSVPVDAVAMALHSDCVLITCRERRTTYRRIRRAVEELSAVRVGATGLVILKKPRLFRLRTDV